MVTANNVKFLSKEPTIGLKIFDGEKLRKRLQITFTDEGNFNIFVNKINQWIGVSVVMKYENLKPYAVRSQSASQGSPLSQVVDISSSQASFEQKMYPEETVAPSSSTKQLCVPLRQSQDMSFEQLASQGLYSQEKSSQPLVPEVTQQQSASQFNPFRNYEDLHTVPLPQIRYPGDASHNGDAFSLLLNAAAAENKKPVMHNESTILSQSTPIRNTFTREESMYIDPTLNDFSIGKGSSAVDLSQALRRLPFNPSNFKKRKSSTSRSHKKHETNELLESTIQRILEKKKDRYLDMGDDELALKLARKLKSKSFVMLLKRVENILG